MLEIYYISLRGILAIEESQSLIEPLGLGGGVSNLFKFLSSSFLNSLKDLSIKKNLKNFDSNTFVFILSFSSTLLLLPLVIYIGIPELSLKFWMVFFISGTLFYIGKYFNFKAIQSEEISYFAPLKAFITLGSLLIGIIILNEVPSKIGLFGLILILIAVYLLNIQKTHTKFLGPIKHIFTNIGARYYLLTIFCYSITIILDKIGVLESYPIFWVFMMNLFLSFLSFIGFKKASNKKKNLFKKNYFWVFITILLSIFSQVCSYDCSSIYICIICFGNKNCGDTFHYYTCKNII